MSLVSRSVLMNLQTMAMAVLLAILVWFYAYAQDTGESNLAQVPIVVQAPAGVLIDKIQDSGGAEVSSVRLKIIASKSSLRDLTRRNIVGRVLLDEQPRGDEPLILEVPLGAAEFELGPAFQVRPSPASLRITLVREDVQRMRVRTSDCTTGTPRAGFRIVEIIATPTFVSVRGPAAVVRKHNEIAVAKVDVTDQAEDFTQVTQIVGMLDGSKVRSESPVTLRFVLQEEEIEREFKLPVRILKPSSFAKPLTLSPEAASIRVRGRRGEIERLDESQMVLYADLFELYRDPEAQMEAGQIYKIPLKLNFLADEIRHVRMLEHTEFTVQVGK